MSKKPTLTERVVVLESMHDDVKEIKRGLFGKSDDPRDFGLAGDIRNNVRWRKNVQRALWLLGAGFLGLVTKGIIEYIKNSGV